MAAFIKGKLKLARESIASKAFDKARDAAREVLSFEPDNYNANVFLGLASLELGDLEESERAYRKAIDSNVKQALAWQGLCKFYEKTKAWQKYAETLLQLARLSSESDDAVKCAETVQKLLNLRREQGSQSEIVEALSLLLPESEFYSVLCTLPPPDPTNPTVSATYNIVQDAVHNSLTVYEELVSITEKDEEDRMVKEVEKRRMRLNAPRGDELRKMIGREIWGQSKLPELYNEIINHPNTSDELRRSTESKLLQYQQRHLKALPDSSELRAEKQRLVQQVQELVNGIVLLNIPDEFAWTIYIDGIDAEFVRRYDWKLLRRYATLFPRTALTKLIQAYFVSLGIPVVEADDEETDFKWSEEEDPVDVIVEAFSELPSSILAHRILVDVYSREKNYPDTIKLAEVGLSLVQNFETSNGKAIPLVHKAFNIALATSFVHLHPPKNHPRALDVLETVLTEDPDNVPCLLGRGYVLQYAQRWKEAESLFERVIGLLPNDLDEGLEAKEEQAWCRARQGNLKESIELLRHVLDVLSGLDDRDVQKARCWWRFGKCFWDMGDEESREEAYQHFITALKRSPSYAPAFTSLGIYYSEHQEPPDTVRASKCFQKAFELDPREAEAARRLTLGFADEREWDLVEVVARRTIEGEGGFTPGTEGTAAARYLPTNVWAWKAVGVVELNKRRYPQAIEAFQIALRSDPDDHSCWVRLGEAYSKGGRHAAAVRALTHARELMPDDWVTLYLIGDVHHQTSRFEEAVTSFESILAVHPSEPGVLLALAQSHLSLGYTQLSEAFLARAEESFLSAITVSLRMIDLNTGFSQVVWKVAADAAFHLSKLIHLVDPAAVDETLTTMASHLTVDYEARLADIVTIPVSPSASSTDGSFALRVAIAAYNYRVSLRLLNEEATAGAWHDLAVALYTLAGSSLSRQRKEVASTRALDCLKSALRGDPTNEKYWIALGHAYFEAQPSLAQHAYIMALEVESKSAVPWTYLGLLYLHHNDLELANEALYKAQVIDPEHTLAWVGQGLVATANGHHEDAMTLFEHVVGLSAAVPEADLEYATRAFSRLSSSSLTTKDEVSEFLLSPFFALDRYIKRRPDDATALHLFALVCERIGHLLTGVELAERSIAILEVIYEETEDPAIEMQFSIANTTLGRLRLAVGDHEGALQSFQSALGLLSKDATDRRTVTLHTHCLFGCGLAQYKLGDLTEALTSFESALEVASGMPDIRGQVSVLLAQTLWEMGTEDCRETAKTQLLQCITEDPENLAAITALAGMGILTNDDGLVDAALSELLSLPRERRNELDPRRDVTYLMIRHHLTQNDVPKAVSIAQDALQSEPSNPGLRRDLTSLLLQKGDARSAAAVIFPQVSDSGNTTNPSAADDVSQTLRLSAIAAGSGEGADRAVAIAHVQRALKLAPWSSDNWDALAYVQSTSSQ